MKRHGSRRRCRAAAMPKRGCPFADAAPLQLKVRVGPRELSRGVCAERYSREIFVRGGLLPARAPASRSADAPPRGPECERRWAGLRAGARVEARGLSRGSGRTGRRAGLGGRAQFRGGQQKTRQLLFRGARACSRHAWEEDCAAAGLPESPPPSRAGAPQVLRGQLLIGPDGRLTRSRTETGLTGASLLAGLAGAAAGAYSSCMRAADGKAACGPCSCGAAACALCALAG
ncbi:LOW QUALITY PROTEIN: Apoptosis regulatory protein Siva [Galemys pyrenaicus]|uniref:Apoptosis regulatory protein Siva n=1 Tax=Galemys pyrenaicus TaxID=202257 RepID=A0A8J6A7L0_GALPY|nr:LOW QUALITY PROTEIN: Apoptosis regulatory protein Siva [Galemys pyrenaicus]